MKEGKNICVMAGAKLCDFQEGSDDILQLQDKTQSEKEEKQ